MHKTTEIPPSPLSNRFKPRKRFHLETFNRIPGANIRISHIVVVIVIHVNCVSSELNALASIARKKRGKKKKRKKKYIYGLFLEDSDATGSRPIAFTDRRRMVASRLTFYIGSGWPLTRGWPQFSIWTTLHKYRKVNLDGWVQTLDFFDCEICGFSLCRGFW